MRKLFFNLLFISAVIICLPVSAQAVDSDGDGLSDFDELLWGTDPCDPDTDNDALWDGDEVYKYDTNPTDPYTDDDTLRDGVEVYVYYTDPTWWTTDGDPYSDGLELKNESCPLDPPSGMGSVQSPGDNVFVAAYPVIEIVVDSNISVEAVSTIEFLEGGSFLGTQEYSITNTNGSSVSVGTTQSHTTGGWVEINNEEADIQQRTTYQDEISTDEEKYWTGYSEGKSTEVEVGAEVGASMTMGVYGKVYGSVKNTVETGSYSDDYKGHSNTKRSGEELTSEKIYKTSTSQGSSEESTFSTTVTKTAYNETSVTDTEAISQGQNWSTATTVDEQNAGILHFSFKIKNTGTDIAEELKDLQFNIYIGDRTPKTIYETDKSNLIPGGEIVVGVDVTLTLEEMGAIDEGEPIKIIVADYSYGTDELFFESAWAEDVLVEIDDGVEDGDESIDHYMTYVDFGETYLDVLKRLNMSVQHGSSGNTYPEIELTLDSNSIISVQNKPVTEWSWWNIYIQDLNDTAPRFSDQPATKKSRLQLVYYQDSDHDFYTDRTELKIGTDHQDFNSHPSPILIAGKIIDDSEPNKTIRLKFTNSGNYDAYGIEAILYSPDDTTTVIDSLIGGGGRIEAGRTFEPNETLIFSVNDINYTVPEVLVRYNDPQGSHTFITKLDISTDPNQAIESQVAYMLESKLSVTTYMHKSDSWIVLDYLNPSSTVYDANITVYYQDMNGVIIDTVNKIVDLVKWDNSFFFYWNPPDLLTLDPVGETFKAVITITDYQGIEIDYDVQKFALEPSDFDKANLYDDSVINFLDFSLFAQDYNDTRDINDLALLAEYWLEEDILKYILHLCSTTGGSVITPGEGAFEYDPCTIVPIMAQPELGVKFLNWSGDLVDEGCVNSSNNPNTTVLLDQSGIIRAQFGHTLDINSSEGGSVISPGEGIFDSKPGSIIKIFAESDIGYIFDEWTGTTVENGKVADPNAAATTVSVDGDYTLYANFVAQLGYPVTVSIGNPGNTADDTGYGSVGYVYEIGKYEVTTGQYTEFLNAVAATDVYGLYNTDMWLDKYGCKIQRSGSSGSYTYFVDPNRANRPVNYVSWYDALRFANWLHNGVPNGPQDSYTTEDGAYDMDGDPNLPRNAGAKVWLLSEDEWYKAAYHKNDGITGNYWEYPTGTDSMPSNDLIEPDPGNNATYWDGDYTIDFPYYMTEVGEFENSGSPYDTFDQGGNVWEWNEAIIGANRGLRGTAFNNDGEPLRASVRHSFPPTGEVCYVGFRVAIRE